MKAAKGISSQKGPKRSKPTKGKGMAKHTNVKVKQKRGPKSKFTQVMFDSICNKIANSSLGLKKITEQFGITTQTFYTWIDNDEKLLDKYMRARDIQADYLADEILAIADDGTNDLMTIEKGDTSYEMENKEVTNRSKLRVEARKWLASKLKPKKYGDKVELSGDKNNPIIHQVTGMEIK